mmetsp:Transcript_32735/g.38506  ORF Transcript_32735/g.38506 Transcript_32735/m.38506 type:complete len:88 (-) Transcript_32735:343-606(-)
MRLGIFVITLRDLLLLIAAASSRLLLSGLLAINYCNILATVERRVESHHFLANLLAATAIEEAHYVDVALASHVSQERLQVDRIAQA